VCAPVSALGIHPGIHPDQHANVPNIKSVDRKIGLQKQRWTHTRQGTETSRNETISTRRRLQSREITQRLGESLTSVSLSHGFAWWTTGNVRLHRSLCERRGHVPPAADPERSSDRGVLVVHRRVCPSLAVGQWHEWAQFCRWQHHCTRPRTVCHLGEHPPARPPERTHGRTDAACNLGLPCAYAASCASHCDRCTCAAAMIVCMVPRWCTFYRARVCAHHCTACVDNACVGGMVLDLHTCAALAHAHVVSCSMQLSAVYSVIFVAAD
jgi:hypothetical protein